MQERNRHFFPKTKVKTWRPNSWTLFFPTLTNVSVLSAARFFNFNPKLLISEHLPISLPHGRIAGVKSLQKRNVLSPPFHRPPNNTWAVQMHPGMSCKQDHKELTYSPLVFWAQLQRVAGQAMKTGCWVGHSHTPSYSTGGRCTLQISPPFWKAQPSLPGDASFWEDNWAETNESKILLLILCVIGFD